MPEFAGVMWNSKSQLAAEPSPCHSLTPHQWDGSKNKKGKSKEKFMGWDKGDLINERKEERKEEWENSDARTVTDLFPEQTDAPIVSKQGQV